MGARSAISHLKLADSHPAARQLLAVNFTGWRKVIEQCLAESADRLPEALDREQLALFVLTTMEGAVMLARAYQDIEPYDAAVTQLRDYFDRLRRDGTDWSMPRPPEVTPGQAQIKNQARSDRVPSFLKRDHHENAQAHVSGVVCWSWCGHVRRCQG